MNLSEKNLIAIELFRVSRELEGKSFMSAKGLEQGAQRAKIAQEHG